MAEERVEPGAYQPTEGFGFGPKGERPTTASPISPEQPSQPVPPTESSGPKHAAPDGPQEYPPTGGFAVGPDGSRPVPPSPDTYGTHSINNVDTRVMPVIKDEAPTSQATAPTETPSQTDQPQGEVPPMEGDQRKAGQPIEAIARPLDADASARLRGDPDVMDATATDTPQRHKGGHRRQNPVAAAISGFLRGFGRKAPSIAKEQTPPPTDQANREPVSAGAGQEPQR